MILLSPPPGGRLEQAGASSFPSPPRWGRKEFLMFSQRLSIRNSNRGGAPLTAASVKPDAIGHPARDVHRAGDSSRVECWAICPLSPQTRARWIPDQVRDDGEEGRAQTCHSTNFGVPFSHWLRNIPYIILMRRYLSQGRSFWRGVIHYPIKKSQ